MSKRRRLWLRFLLFVGRRRGVVEYLRYRGLTMKEVALRREDLAETFCLKNELH